VLGPTTLQPSQHTYQRHQVFRQRCVGRCFRGFIGRAQRTSDSNIAQAATPQGVVESICLSEEPTCFSISDYAYHLASTSSFRASSLAFVIVCSNLATYSRSLLACLQRFGRSYNQAYDQTASIMKLRNERPFDLLTWLDL